jgi:hypothetical protein
MVLDQIAYWEGMNPDFLSQVEFILIDDCSEQVAELPATTLNLRVFRILTNIPWNQSGSRNLGMFLAKAEWALFTDIDQKLHDEPMSKVLTVLNRLNRKRMFHFKIKELINILTQQKLLYAPSTFLVHLPTFKIEGRWDEDFAGHYGYEDLYAHKVWQNHGSDRSLFDDAIYFEDMGFGTSNLNRDNTRNDLLSQEKMQAGIKNSPNILRFEWEQVAIPAHN